MKSNTGVSGQQAALQVVIKGARFIPPCVCLRLSISKIVAKKKNVWRITCGRSGREGSPGTGYTWLSSTFHWPKLCHITTSNCKKPGKCSPTVEDKEKQIRWAASQKGTEKDQDYNLTCASHFSIFESLNSLETHLTSEIIWWCFRRLQKAPVPQFMSQCRKNSARVKEIIRCLWGLQEDGWGGAMHRTSWAIVL